MGTSLPWVKVHTRIVASPKWRSLPPSDRSVFLHLLVLAGLNGADGAIEGSDKAIADAIALPLREVQNAIRRLSAPPHESLSRTAGGLQITKWAEYQPGQRLLSHGQRGSARGLAATQPMAAPVARVDQSRVEKSREGQPTTVLVALDALGALPGWVADDGRDIELVKELSRRFPTVDLVASVSGLRDWLLDGGTTGNLRNTVRNRIAKSFEFGKDLKTSSDVLGWRAG